jgi:hypothetical protein
MVEWFRRFADIPGVAYTAPPKIDPTNLEGFGAVPTEQAFDAGGRHYESLNWSYADMAGSASPAQSRAFGNYGDASAEEVVANCYEGLELPGEPEDYHFLIQGCATELWRRRREEPRFIEEVERLCWLDLELVEKHPAAITYDNGDGNKYYGVEAFTILIEIYEREGDLRNAFNVAERAIQYGQGAKVRDELAERIAAVENEAIG